MTPDGIEIRSQIIWSGAGIVILLIGIAYLLYLLIRLGERILVVLEDIRVMNYVEDEGEQVQLAGSRPRHTTWEDVKARRAAAADETDASPEQEVTSDTTT